mmetsp:Transcript_25553/g.56863  ORF Transcript_25553/g.56863 Transcript_25553/m.56863 type:complete len:219 (-) Transcript_25553:413-1069(-)
MPSFVISSSNPSLRRRPGRTKLGATTTAGRSRSTVAAAAGTAGIAIILLLGNNVLGRGRVQRLVRGEPIEDVTGGGGILHVLGSGPGDVRHGRVDPIQVKLDGNARLLRSGGNVIVFIIDYVVVVRIVVGCRAAALLSLVGTIVVRPYGRAAARSFHRLVAIGGGVVRRILGGGAVVIPTGVGGGLRRSDGGGVVSAALGRSGGRLGNGGRGRGGFFG